jgi:hypothetical protein
MSDIATLQNQILAAIGAADTPDALEAVRIDALGKQGSVSALLKTLGQMSPEERQVQGPAINGLREAVTNGIATKKAELETAILNQRLATERLDMTLPAPEAPPALTDGTQPEKSEPGKPEWFGFARRLAGLIRREPDVQAKADWRLSTALANVDERGFAGPRRMPDSHKTSIDLHREALHVVEKLQALAIDLDRALGDDPAPDLWRRYVNGERSVFTRRLVAMIGREGADRIAERYAADTDFRTHADRYMSEFEGLLDDAAARDRDQVLAETFLTSQTGRLYLLLAAATGRL